ncbi:MAG TPA: hypothetical protein VFG69_01365 [Nannocystaceae bacterium]|nr:hypothetical protein [Nannocystaceae bacterium]
MKRLLRFLHALVPIAMAAFIVLPALPGQGFGPLPRLLGRALLVIGVKQSWGMYAPDPQRSHHYMELVAHYDDGTEALLEESADAEHGWGTIWAWQKTRLDIWKFYANFHPNRRNDHRLWYLRMVCVREARTGRTPQKITMHQVTRKFASPAKVRKGAPGLGKPVRKLVTVQHCRTAPTGEMIAEDALRRGEDHG